MKTYQYLHVIVTNKNGTKFLNPLKLSEAHIISKIAQENESLTITLKICSKEQYKLRFNQ